VASLEYQRAKLAEESQAAATELQVARAEALRALQTGEPNGGTSANGLQLEHEEENGREDTVVIVPGESYLVLTICRVRVGVELNSEPIGEIRAGEVVGKSLIILFVYPRLAVVSLSAAEMLMLVHSCVGD
jgi:hypothetical protein